MGGFLSMKIIKNGSNSNNLQSNKSLTTIYDDIFSEPIKKFPCQILNWNDNSIWSLDFSYPYLAVGGNNKTAFIINITNFRITNLTENKHNIPCVKFSPCGNFVATASVDEHVRIFDIYTARCVKCIKPVVSDL